MDEEQRLVEMYARMERRLAAVYSACASTFPAEAPLWSRLAAEETDHLCLAQTLVEAAADHRLTVSDAPLRRHQLEGTLRRVDGLDEGVNEGTLDGLRALRHAHAVERAIVDQEVFSSLRSDEPDLMAAVARLHDESVAHAQALFLAIELQSPSTH